MAVGFPTKANWAAGDVLTASALDDLAGTVNLLSNASTVSPALMQHQLTKSAHQLSAGRLSSAEYLLALLALSV